MTEPQPPDPHWPRYSSRAFPLYRYVPGHAPHPRRHAAGHAYGQSEPARMRISADRWQESDDYLYGIDLFNFAYWWESHELFEAFWHAAGRETEQGHFFQGLIQLAAANLKLAQGNRPATLNLLRYGIAHLQRVPGSYMGIDIAGVIQALSACLDDPQPQAPPLRLDINGRRTADQKEKQPGYQ